MRGVCVCACFVYDAMMCAYNHIALCETVKIEINSDSKEFHTGAHARTFSMVCTRSSFLGTPFYMRCSAAFKLPPQVIYTKFSYVCVCVCGVLVYLLVCVRCAHYNDPSTTPGVVNHGRHAMALTAHAREKVSLCLAIVSHPITSRVRAATFGALCACAVVPGSRDRCFFGSEFKTKKPLCTPHAHALNWWCRRHCAAVCTMFALLHSIII